MGEIRKQVLQSSFLSYIGFVVGAINTYFFTRQGLFTPEQYGLTQVIISMSQIIAPLASLGMTLFINRFSPYYFDNLDKKRNDMLMVTLIFSGIGAILMFGGCLIFQPLVVRKFQTKSALVVEYYYWTLLFSFFYLGFMILESYLWALKKTVLPAFMKETAYRLCVMILIGLYAFQVINFGTFVILFCCIYLLIVAIMVTYLLWVKQFHIASEFSHVTRRFKKRIRTYVSYVYSGIAVNAIARQIDTLALAGAKNLQDTGVYSLNQFFAAILQVPYRGLQAIVIPMIAEHWKNKNYAEIDRIYQRSSINLLLIASFLFVNVWLNYDDGLHVLHIDTKFAAGKTVFLILGLYNIFELGTGANAALISTSPAWRFEFYTSLLLLTLSIPLNIFMARWKGMEGVALATMLTFTIYNIIRLIIIKYKFNMWPFTRKTIYAIVAVTGSYLVTWLLLHAVHGFTGIILRSLLFSGLFLACVFFLQLTPDLPQFIAVVQKRLGRKK